MTTNLFGRSLPTLLASNMPSPALAHDTAGKREAKLFGPGLHHTAGSTADPDGRPPLYDGLADIRMPVTTDNPAGEGRLRP